MRYVRWFSGMLWSFVTTLQDDTKDSSMRWCDVCWFFWDAMIFCDNFARWLQKIVACDVRWFSGMLWSFVTTLCSPNEDFRKATGTTVFEKLLYLSAIWTKMLLHWQPAGLEAHRLTNVMAQRNVVSTPSRVQHGGDWSVSVNGLSVFCRYVRARQHYPEGMHLSMSAIFVTFLSRLVHCVLVN